MAPLGLVLWLAFDGWRVREIISILQSSGAMAAFLSASLVPGLTLACRDGRIGGLRHPA